MPVLIKALVLFRIDGVFGIYGDNKTKLAI